MLRIHFTSDDLARTRIAPRADALWEVLLSLHRLRRKEGMAVFDEWRRRARGRLPASTRLLADLAPPRGYMPDFLTPATARGSLEEGVEALRSTPRRRIRTDLTELTERHPRLSPPAETHAMTEGDTRPLDRLARSVTEYFHACLAPYWERIQAQLERDRVTKGRAVSEHGWEAVLPQVHPSARWSYPVLELAFPAEQDIHLEGRGLLLQPSFFCWGEPTTLLDTDLSPVLVYPAERHPLWASGPQATPSNAVAALLGRTRAQVLETIAQGECSTSELSRRAHIPAPTASQQAAVLREAGLTSTHRHGRSVLHTATPLGASLLEGAPAGSRN